METVPGGNDQPKGSVPEHEYAETESPRAVIWVHLYLIMQYPNICLYVFIKRKYLQSQIYFITLWCLLIFNMKVSYDYRKRF